MTALEKAARAAWALTCPGLKAEEIGTVFAAQSEQDRKMFEGLARAVLMSIREPTPEMNAAAEELWGEEIGINYVQLDPEDFFTAMIDAILSEGESK